MEHLGQLNNEEEGEHFANESIHMQYLWKNSQLRK